MIQYVARVWEETLLSEISFVTIPICEINKALSVLVQVLVRLWAWCWDVKIVCTCARAQVFEKVNKDFNTSGDIFFNCGVRNLYFCDHSILWHTTP